LQEEEAQDSSELSSWQKNILNERLEDYYKKPNDIVDFYTTLDKIRKGI
jgi:hypothetical protein